MTPHELAADSTPAAGVHLRSLADELRQVTLHVVWRQWRALGAAPATPDSARELRSQIDPEALVLVSLTLMNSERRLADLLHDWAAVNSSLLSVQRIRNLAVDYVDAGDRSVAIHLAWFAATARDHGKDVRWSSIASSWPGNDGPAAAQSASRPRRESTRRVAPAPLASESTLLLRLRLGLGVGVKADLLAYLLGSGGEWATIREIVAATSYTPAAVRRAALDLANARMIEERSGSPAGYRANVKRWSALLELRDEVPAWADWRSKFLFVDAMLRWGIQAAERPLTPAAFSAQARELIEHHRRAFEQDQIATWSERTPISDWGEFASRGIRGLARWMVESA